METDAKRRVGCARLSLFDPHPLTPDSRGEGWVEKPSLARLSPGMAMTVLEAPFDGAQGRQGIRLTANSSSK